MSKFKPGDRVRLKDGNMYWYGTITIVTNEGVSKVLFDSGDAPDYWYYEEKELELVESEKRE